MAPSIRVPWYSWKRFRVRGVVVDQTTGRPLAGHRVAAFDKDLVYDDFLGDAETDANGEFEIRFLDTDFKDMTEVRPDLYLQVFAPDSAAAIVDTSGEVRKDASEDEYYEIRIPPRADRR